jgi:hypothetical protein
LGLLTAKAATHLARLQMAIFTLMKEQYGRNAHTAIAVKKAITTFLTKD